VEATTPAAMVEAMEVNPLMTIDSPSGRLDISQETPVLHVLKGPGAHVQVATAAQICSTA
jgi:hypothetical protein